MAQGEDLGQHRGVASDQQSQSTDQPDHHQVQHSNQHADDRYRVPGNPSSPYMGQDLARHRAAGHREATRQRPRRRAGTVEDQAPGTVSWSAPTDESSFEAQADAAAVFGAGKLTDRAGSATKQSLTDAAPNNSSSMRCRASTLGASQMQIVRLTSSCVTLLRSSKPGGNSKFSTLTTESHAARSRIVCTTPRCMTPPPPV